MSRERFERGAVVAYSGRSWVIWSYPRARYAEPLALPIVPQHGPRHRSHVRVDLGGRAVMIQTLDAVPLVGADCMQTGRLTHDVISEIEQTMQRAALARDLEGAR